MSKTIFIIYLYGMQWLDVSFPSFFICFNCSHQLEVREFLCRLPRIRPTPKWLIVVAYCGNLDHSSC